MTDPCAVCLGTGWSPVGDSRVPCPSCRPGAVSAPLAVHEHMDRWRRLPVWAQQELEQWRMDEAHQRGRAQVAEAAARRYREALLELREMMGPNGREAFVMQGMRSFAAVLRIVEAALGEMP